MDFKKAFEIICSSGGLSKEGALISEVISNNGRDTTRSQIQEIAVSQNKTKISDLKPSSTKVLLSYVEICLNDNILSKLEKENIKFLKLLLSIKEGDFKKDVGIEARVNEIIRVQLHLLYVDNKIDSTEEMQKVDLQDVFDIGYDEFLKFANYEDSQALQRGAQMSDLDSIIIHETDEESGRSRHIGQSVKDKVWVRDNGRCVQCASNENLEFDHIIPFSKGGANTYRNIQLLCQSCNRIKSNEIGSTLEDVGGDFDSEPESEY